MSKKKEDAQIDPSVYRDVEVDDVIQMRYDSSSPYFKEVVTNQGIFVKIPLAVELLSETDEKGKVRRGGYYSMYPVRSPNGSQKTSFVLYSDTLPVRTVQMYDALVVRQILTQQED